MHEQELVQRIRAGDQEAINELIRNNGHSLFRVVYGVVKDQKHAEDITQETFIQILNSLPEYRGQGLKTWMARIAVNKAIDFKRKAFVRRELVSDQDEQFEVPAQEVNPVEAAALKKERDLVVRRRLEQMPVKYKEVVYAYYFEEKSYEEIAAETGLAYKSVEARLYRARKWMQKHWKEELW